MVLYGTRPEAIKLAPLIRALQEHEVLDPVVAVTGQHREILDQVNTLFGITPHHDLDLMVHGASLGDIASRTLSSTSAMLSSNRPDAVVVQGDTSTAFIAALAAFYQQIPVIHLEAGLRTHNLASPFPEEANRQLTTRIASLHLAPTSASRDNLLREGVLDEDVSVTGNTVIDALHETLRVPVIFDDPRVGEIVSGGDRFVLVTAHRRESWGAPMREAMTAIRDVALRHPDLRWILPMHPNPVVRNVVEDVLGDLSAVTLVNPLSYHEFAFAMRSAHLLLTDSGGVQEEAPSLGKPVLVMRATTERPEAVDAGTVELVGTKQKIVAASLDRLLDDDDEYAIMAKAVNPYGDGKAVPRCIAAIEELFGLGSRLPDFEPHH